VLGTRKDLDQIILREVRAKHEQPCEVELAGTHSLEQCREASDETSGGNAAKGLVLREAELVDAVSVETRAGARAVNAAQFDLAEVNEELGEHLIRAAYEAARPSKELGVREMIEQSSGMSNGPIDRCVRLHASQDKPAFSTLLIGALAGDRGSKRDVNQRSKQELSSAPAACRAL
jgi:hypothetical protein